MHLKHFKFLEILTNGSISFKNEYFYKSKVILFIKKDKHNFELMSKNKTFFKHQLNSFVAYKNKYKF